VGLGRGGWFEQNNDKPYGGRGGILMMTLINIVSRWRGAGVVVLFVLDHMRWLDEGYGADAELKVNLKST
jgi:hypothetical protein